MYIGSTVNTTIESHNYNFSTQKNEGTELTYIPAIQTLFAEVINNSLMNL
jgi:hypothetical protein